MEKYIKKFKEIKINLQKEIKKLEIRILQMIIIGEHYKIIKNKSLIKEYTNKLNIERTAQINIKDNWTNL